MYKEEICCKKGKNLKSHFPEIISFGSAIPDTTQYRHTGGGEEGTAKKNNFILFIKQE